jgi:ABC-type Fe3+-hydroxamate transport system substrate-binding protein
MSLPARRVISLVPSLTETVCDLGVSGRLVAVTRFCVSPADELQFVPRVGGTKNPDLEQIARHEPDLILANGEENRSEDIDWLSQRFEVYLSRPTTLPDAAKVVRDVGHRLGVEDETESLLLEIEAQLAYAEVMNLDRQPIRVFYPIWKQPWIGVNRNTYVHDMLTRAGAINVCATRESRYPVVALTELGDLAAELVLLPSSPFAFSADHRRELMNDRTFGRNVPILMVDGRNFCWHGSRTARGLGNVTNLLRPFRRAS